MATMEPGQAVREDERLVPVDVGVAAAPGELELDVDVIAVLEVAPRKVVLREGAELLDPTRAPLPGP
jgi:hypothetical protein